MHTTKIVYKQKEYELETSKLLYVISRLKNEEIASLSEDDLLEELKHFDLLQEDFLEGVNNL